MKREKMEEQRVKELFATILDLGAILLKSGAEVYRVEDTIKRLIIAYGGTDEQVFAIPTHIVASACFGAEEITSSRRVRRPGMSLEIVDRVNALARFACDERPEPAQLKRKLNEAAAFEPYTPTQQFLIYALVAFSFTLFFGGCLVDSLISAVIAGMLFFNVRFFKRITQNALFGNILSAAFMAILAVLSVRIGAGTDADKIIIGNVMLLIPGLEFVNGMRDFIVSDIQAGIMHITEALFLAAGTALGAAAVLTVFGGAI